MDLGRNPREGSSFSRVDGCGLYGSTVIFPWYVCTIAQCLDGVISFVSVFLPSELCSMLTVAGLSGG